MSMTSSRRASAHDDLRNQLWAQARLGSERRAIGPSASSAGCRRPSRTASATISRGDRRQQGAVAIVAGGVDEARLAGTGADHRQLVARRRTQAGAHFDEVALGQRRHQLDGRLHQPGHRRPSCSRRSRRPRPSRPPGDSRRRAARGSSAAPRGSARRRARAGAAAAPVLEWAGRPARAVRRCRIRPTQLPADITTTSARTRAPPA